MSSRTSYTQFSIMVEFMEKYGDLSKPQSLPNGRLWCIGKWKELTNLLNSEGIGEIRSEEKWRKVWSDLKNNTKRKWAKIHRSVQGTGGGPALKLCLSDVENRVINIIGVQAAVGMPIAELGFGLVDESVVSAPAESQEAVMDLPAETPIIIDDGDWNTPGSRMDPGPIPPEQHGSQTNSIRPVTPPVSVSPPPPSPTVHHSQSTPQPPPSQQPQRKRKHRNIAEEYFVACEANAREDIRERERLYLDIERERIRQRDTELQLQAQWLEFMKVALNMLDTYLKEK